MKFNIGDNVRVIKGMCEGELANILRFEGKDNSVVLLEVGEGELMYTTIDSIEKVHKVYNLIELCQVAKNGDKFEDNYGNLYTFFDGELVYDEDDENLITDLYTVYQLANLTFTKVITEISDRAWGRIIEFFRNRDRENSDIL